MTHPLKPPQVIEAGDSYADMITIWLDGKPDEYSLWIRVDAEAGEGMRLVTDENGKLIREGYEAKTETVRGNFEVKWASE